MSMGADYDDQNSQLSDEQEQANQEQKEKDMKLQQERIDAIKRRRSAVGITGNQSQTLG